MGAIRPQRNYPHNPGTLNDQHAEEHLLGTPGQRECSHCKVSKRVSIEGPR